MRFALLVVVFFLCFETAPPAFGRTTTTNVAELNRALRQVRSELGTLDSRLDGQSEARDRQADAFDAATKQIEVVNAALAIILALGGIGATLLALRWVQSYTRAQVQTRIDSTLRQVGSATFDREARDLREEYETKFAELYSRYNRLIDK